MADFVSVSNMALDRVGEPYRITDPAEDTHPARICRSEWDNARRAVLRRGKFNFSMTRAALTAQAATDPAYQPPAPHANRFPVPGACVRVVEVYDGSGCLVTDYKFESGAILTDADGPLTLRFVRDVPEIGAWDDLSTAALVERLGYGIADALTGDTGRRDRCLAAFNAATKETAGVDAKEDPPEAPFDSSWVTSRFGFDAGGPPNVWPR